MPEILAQVQAHEIFSTLSNEQRKQIALHGANIDSPVKGHLVELCISYQFAQLRKQ
jgi:hypothetical protein